MRIVSAVLAVVFTLLFLAWGTVRTIAGINFDRGCEGYLKRAADANTVQLADRNLAVAVKYLEDNQMTSGYTSVLWRTPDEDVGFWYANLNSSLEELHSVKPEATQLEKTNVLMKLRETLLDQGQSTTVTAPDGISIYPNNSFYWWWGVLSSFFAVVFILFAIPWEEL